MRLLQASMVAAVIAVFVAPAIVGAIGTSYDPPRKCFSKRLWSGPDRERPCIRVWKVYEDGSGRVVVETARGEVLAVRVVNVPW